VSRRWLNWKCGIALGAASEKVRVAAQCLEIRTLIDAYFAAGEISYSKVRAMTRVVTLENEDFLLRIAQHGTASHVEKAVGKYKQVQAADDATTTVSCSGAASSGETLGIFNDTFSEIHESRSMAALSVSNTLRKIE
jgi:hypothetical protein